MNKTEFRSQLGEKEIYLKAVKNLDWVAGFFDGEGCIYFHPSSLRSTQKGVEYYSPCVQVILAQSGDNGKLLLECFQEVYATGKITTAHGSSLTKQTPYMTRMSGKKALKFLKLIEPHLLLKQEKARFVIASVWEHYFDK